MFESVHTDGRTHGRTDGRLDQYTISSPLSQRLRRANRIGQSQSRVIIYINLVEPESPLVHAKFQDHRTSGSGEIFFKGFYHIWAWRPSWSCDLYHLHKLSSPLPKEDSHDFGIDWPIGFREDV